MSFDLEASIVAACAVGVITLGAWVLALARRVAEMREGREADLRALLALTLLHGRLSERVDELEGRSAP